MAELVLQTTNAATASVYDLYQPDDSKPLPEAGEYSDILASEGNAVGVIRTTTVYVAPFSLVCARLASDA